MIVDGPFCVMQSKALGQKCFRNFSGGYAGPQTMRWGLEQSRNLMTVRAAAQTGMDKVVKTAKTMGLGEYPSVLRSEEHTSELQSLMRISYAVFFLKKKKKTQTNNQ